MSGANLPSHMKINLESSTILLVDDNQMSLDIMSSVFYGFGARDRMMADNLDDARRMLTGRYIDLMVIDSGFPDEAAFRFMAWLRHEAPDPVCFTPTIMVTGHSTRALVRRARDSGAHFVIAKPITPGVLLNRVAWIAHEKRPFVKNAIYSGPDRRWKNAGIPPGAEGRRIDDLPMEVGEASEPNMSQNELDAMLKPQKVAL